MWLRMVDPAQWCAPDAYFLTSPWKVQKELLSRCLCLVLAEVHAEQGIAAAWRLAAALLAATPRSDGIQRWLPNWANKNYRRWRQEHGQAQGRPAQMLCPEEVQEQVGALRPIAASGAEGCEARRVGVEEQGEDSAAGAAAAAAAA